LPFIRLAFIDIDNDGMQEMIAGSKDGFLRLYRRASASERRWEQVPGYFENVAAGAFSSPAAGDLDMDGMPEIVVGTGGFSKESGRILIYRNEGTGKAPSWRVEDIPLIDVGDDAAPALIDVNNDGRPDLVIGNSTGALVLYRNTSVRGKISFVRDNSYFAGLNVGMYGMPAAVMHNKRPVIVAGNSMGKLLLLDRPQGQKTGWQKIPLKISFPNFAAPAFFQDREDAFPNLVVSDGNGQIHFYSNSRSDLRDWNEESTFFAGRVMPGPACSPSMSELDNKTYMVTGNINGELKLYEFRSHAEVLPWTERPNFFRGIKLSGFSKGSLAVWKGKSMLITGQQDGFIRAFLNHGTPESPVWKEQKDFFRGIPRLMHASPVAFDLDGDERWEVVAGDVEGNLHAYRMEEDKAGRVSWKTIEGAFSGISCGRYASPALVRDKGRVYLFIGQQDGRLLAYSASDRKDGLPLFAPDDIMETVAVSNHSSPSAIIRNGVIEMSVGDYNGNLRHYACSKKDVEIR